MQTPKTCIILHLRSVCNHMQYYAIKLTRYYARHTILNFIIKVFKSILLGMHEKIFLWNIIKD